MSAQVDQPRRTGLFLAGGALSGALLLASTPPFGLHVLAWIALVPLFLVVRRVGFGAALLAGFVAGAVFDLHTAWMLELDGLNPLNYGVAVSMRALYLAGFGLLAAGLHRRLPGADVWTFPALWVAIEYLRLHSGFLSFPWGLLAYSQWQVLPVAAIAGVGGVYGVSFLIAAVNGVIAELVEARGLRLRPAPRSALGVASAAGLVLAAAFLSGAAPGAAPGEVPRLRVAAVQAGIYSTAADSRGRREVLEGYRRLTLEAAANGPALIVWPESAVPGRIPWDRGLVGHLTALARASNAHLLVGSTGRSKRSPGEAKRPSANSAFFVTPGGEIAGSYDKIRLLPFNEYTPLRGIVRWPGWIAPQRRDARPGSERTIFEVDGVRFGVLICWENLFPDDVRQTVARGVDFLVGLTNEAFTRSPVALEQMLAINVFRAIENGVAIVRPSTTGVTALIEPDGRVSARFPERGAEDAEAMGWLVGEIPLARRRTFYTAHGDWLVHFIVLPSLAWAVLASLVAPTARLEGSK